MNQFLLPSSPLIRPSSNKKQKRSTESVVQHLRDSMPPFNAVKIAKTKKKGNGSCGKGRAGKGPCLATSLFRTFIARVGSARLTDPRQTSAHSRPG